MNINILSEKKINKIVSLANETNYAGIIKMDIEQSLMVMLSITHYFKFEMDYKIEWYAKHEDRLNREIEQFKTEQGIKNGWDEMQWIIKNGALQYHMCIQDLLLQTLYTLNGTHYRTRDRDYAWEEEFNKIFVRMPYGREFDLSMIQFLLLPLYNRTHETNYVMEEGLVMNNDDHANE